MAALGAQMNGAGKCHKRTQRTGKSLAHVLFLSAALSLLSALVRRERRQLVLTARDRRKKVRVAPRRIAASLAFATLFFAGAALSAGAGNSVVQLIDPSSESALRPTRPTTTDTTTGSATAIAATDRERTRSPADAAGLRTEQPRRRRRRRPRRRRSTRRQTAPPAAPVASRRTARRSNTNAAGVRSTLKARLHAGLRKPGVASTAHARPGSAQMVPARLLRPQVPP